MEKKSLNTNNRKIVTLTTDWGDKDYYVGAVKGKLHSLIPDVEIVDISHNINTFDVNHAGYVINNVYETFPKGTIHILGVDSEEYVVNERIQSHLLVKYKGYYFIGADNGIFSLITSPEEAEEIYEITLPFAEVKNEYKYIFSVRDRLVYVAAQIANGDNLDKIGKPIDNFKTVIQMQPTYSNSYIKGVVIHVDNYENVIVNISEKLFYSLLKDRKFNLYFRNYTINSISKQYYDVNEQQIVALFNSSGLLEIAINKGKASSLLGLRLNDTVTVEFFD